MKPVLSIVLPVRNAHHSLAAQVHELLELVPELTTKFEILIVDDGSTDHTDELAHELSCAYPQVAFVRHGKSLGYAAAVKSALAKTRGETVFVQEEGARLSPTDLRRLWSMREDENLVLARSTPGPLGQGLLSQLGLWGQALRDAGPQNTGGVQMIRRAAVDQLRQSEKATDGLTIAHAPRTEMVRRDVPHPKAKERPRRAVGFLGHLRDLATGE